MLLNWIKNQIQKDKDIKYANWVKNSFGNSNRLYEMLYDIFRYANIQSVESWLELMKEHPNQDRIIYEQVVRAGDTLYNLQQESEEYFVQLLELHKVLVTFNAIVYKDILNEEQGLYASLNDATSLSEEAHNCLIKGVPLNNKIVKESVYQLNIMLKSVLEEYYEEKTIPLEEEINFIKNNHYIKL